MRAPRRGGRRPGWLLLTVLLVLAIGASSALVFTNRVELLKLAVILALWAAVVAAFVSVIYRRQSDVDQAKVRDLKLVYDLQLDREISARREYELTVETQLRRELTSETAGPGRRRGRRSAGRAGRAAGQFGDPVRRRPVAPARARNRSQPGPTVTGRAAPNRRAGSPPAGSTPKTATTSTRTPRKARSSTCLPNPIRPSHDWAADVELRWCAPQTVGDRAGGAATSRGGARRAWSPPPPPPQPRRRSRSPSHRFAWQPPQQERPPALPPEPPAPPPRPAEPERGSAGAVDGLAARARRRGSGYPREHRAATGCRLTMAEFADSPTSDSSRRRSTMRPHLADGQPAMSAAEPSAGDAAPEPRTPSPASGRHSVRRTPSTRRRLPTLATESGESPPHPPRSSQETRRPPEPEGRRATPQRRGHRRAVGCRTAGQAAGLPTGGGRRRRRDE